MLWQFSKMDGVRTAHNPSPNQLFVAGILQVYQTGLTALDFLDNVVDESYGIEENGFTVHEDEGAWCYRWSVNTCYNCNRKLIPLPQSQNHGIELHETTVHFITQIIEQNQSLYLK